ncbi:Plus-end-directed kinesin ATPase [Bertholletia excelsa]
MGSISGDEQTSWDLQGSTGPEEKIFVAVRLRPLNERETMRNDDSDWECVNNNTIIYKNVPTAYTFDKVYGSDCSTKQVYDEAAKKIALSVVNGINSTIFAYGQTSSGKTYTMSGITEYTIADIFNHINEHDDREFVLKFSAMEIYNEAVRDLLSPDSTPLRLLDDPERGTVVDKLTEETLTDWSHFKELLCVCEVFTCAAQRHIGETSLNELSSRSHQIIRLTIESSARSYNGAENSSTLTASVNFVDLAGSERASQTLSAGARLKEGSHINRSLLTLGTVIRKLSKGRTVHIPYRDSKLTRILQNSLGGNARTCIICTMSPARSHVEQSRNTLLFASCAKQVSTNAHVNLVMNDKALVKQLQRELARMESELRDLGATSTGRRATTLLKEKELLIEKMDKEIKELKEQHNLAQSRIDDLLQSMAESQVSRSLAGKSQLSELSECSASESSEVVDPLRFGIQLDMSHLSDGCDGFNHNKQVLQFSDQSEEQFLSDNISPRLVIDKLFGPDPSQGWEMTVPKDGENSEDHCKEVRCIEVEESYVDGNSKSSSSHIPEELSCEALKAKIREMQKTIDYLANSCRLEQSPSSCITDASDIRSIKLHRSRSCLTIESPCFETAEHGGNTIQNGFVKDLPPLKNVSSMENLSRKDSETPNSDTSKDKREKSDSILEGHDVYVDTAPLMLDKVEKYEHNLNSGNDLLGQLMCGTLCSSFKTEIHFPISLVDLLVAMTQVQEDKPKTDELVKIVKSIDLDIVQGAPQPPSTWPLEFERKQREIIELWDACYVPLTHRSQFFLLFKGFDPSDSVYMEVELRRLSFLKSKLSLGTKIMTDGQILTPATSKKSIDQERQMLRHQMLKKFSPKEREALYQKWGIGLKTKRRRRQLSCKLWTNTKDMSHIKESADLVAKLAGLGETPKEMFGMSFSPRPMVSKAFSWKHTVSSLI